MENTVVSRLRISFINKKFALHLLTSFLLGRVFLLESISPFGEAYLCSYTTSAGRSTLQIVLTALASVAGVLTTGYSNTALRFLLSYVLFGLIYISVSAIRNKKDRITAATCAFVANLTAGTIFYAQLEGFIYNFSMLTAECAAGFVLVFVLSKVTSLINDHTDFATLKDEDTVGIYVLLALVATGFCGLYIGNISVGKALGGLLIMIIAYCGGCTLATTCGVGLGILNSLYAFELNEFAGVFGFCGLCAGAMSRHKRPGIILGFIISAKLISVYFGGWSDSVFTDLETIIAVCLFCLIPLPVLIGLKGFLTIKNHPNEEIKQSVKVIKSSMKNVAKSLTSLADLSGNMFANLPPNTADFSTVYDTTANRICRSCGLKFICWDKDVFDTRDSLNKAMEILYHKNYITEADMPDTFRQKCIKHQNFVKELNRIYFAFKMDNRWKNTVSQSQRLISMQLEGMSYIVDNMSDHISEGINFDKTEETKIYCSLEEEGIKCLDVTVVKDLGSSSVTVTVKQNPKKADRIFAVTEKAVSAVTGKAMTIESYTCHKNRYTFKLTEKESFGIEFACISTPKKGELQCGDTVVNGKISDGKYVIILSDGMGSGKNAARLSQSAAQLMKGFLGAGFDRKKAVQMIGSAIMINNTESFTTIDTVIIDLFTARAEFIKAGANTTYIKHNNTIQKINSTALPVGIIDNIDADAGNYYAQSGDIIIMISDGIHNAADNWFEDYIINMHEETPEIIAQLLYDEAQRNKKQEDDMTVAVAKITGGI